jgi:exoribonuclease-2
VAERLPGGATLLRVGIADVDAWIARGTPLDRHAATNTVSIHAGVETLHMIPEPLATDRSSLLPEMERLALVVEFVVDRTGAVSGGNVYRALLCNQARLDYDAVAAWLQGDREALPHAPVLIDQLELHDAAILALRARREQDGALDLDLARPELQPLFEGDRLVDLVVLRPDRAHVLIEEIMVTANSVIAEYLGTRGIPWIARGQMPRYWEDIVDLALDYGEVLPPAADRRALAAFLHYRSDADPEEYSTLQARIARMLGGSGYYIVPPGERPPGHFSLGLKAYTRATAPNRRFIDLVMQRVLKAAITGDPAPYSIAELEAIVETSVERAKAADRVARDLIKRYASLLLQRRVGEVFDAVVTSVNSYGAWARLDHPPVEGRIMYGADGLVSGTPVRVRLTDTNWQRGYINLALAG